MQPQQAARLLAGINVPWWVAGGWALDLFLGFQTRPHDDFDVGILRRNVADVIAGFPEWQFFEARSEVLYRLGPCERPRAEVNSLWARPRNVDGWSLELMLDEADDDTWVFRRLPAIRMSLAKAVKRTSEGIPYLTPEIQLLYKARQPRAKDLDDFERVVERLGVSEREWLRDALSLVDPQHAWVTKLRR